MSETTARRIVLTGATRGLGRAMVETFVEFGHQVLGCGRAADLIADLSERFGEPHAFHVVDVGVDSEVKAWAEDVISRYGPPDLLLNNAAVMNRQARLWEIAANEFDVLTTININGVANVIRHFVPAMVERGSGVIVNFSSTWGRSTAPDVAPYCGSKWAIEGLTRALAQELPNGMAAVPFNPGIIATDMLRTCFGEAAEHYPKPEQWARRAVPFLLSLGPKDSGKAVSVAG